MEQIYFILANRRIAAVLLVDKCIRSWAAHQFRTASATSMPTWSVRETLGLRLVQHTRRLCRIHRDAEIIWTICSSRWFSFWLGIYLTCEFSLTLSRNSVTSYTRSKRIIQQSSAVSWCDTSFKQIVRRSPVTVSVVVGLKFDLLNRNVLNASVKISLFEVIPSTLLALNWFPLSLPPNVSTVAIITSLLWFYRIYSFGFSQYFRFSMRIVQKQCAAIRGWKIILSLCVIFISPNDLLLKSVRSL